MSGKTRIVVGFILMLAVVYGCATTQVQQADPGPPPPQNLIGSTDELQLVTELSTDLARKYGSEQVLVVLEIDNTLLTKDQDVDCTAAAMRPAQPDAAEQVRRMQESGLKVIVMSSRGPECRQQTMSELDRNGFSFRASAWPPQDGYAGAFIPAGSHRSVEYNDGVFLVAGQDKGRMLHVLLDKAGVPHPVLIVIADRQQDSLNEVMKAFSHTGTKIQAWRYTRQVSDTVAQASEVTLRDMKELRLSQGE